MHKLAIKRPAIKILYFILLDNFENILLKN
jgi:hypothetical protein